MWVDMSPAHTALKTTSVSFLHEPFGKLTLVSPEARCVLTPVQLLNLGTHHVYYRKNHSFSSQREVGEREKMSQRKEELNEHTHTKIKYQHALSHPKNERSDMLEHALVCNVSTSCKIHSKSSQLHMI